MVRAFSNSFLAFGFALAVVHCLCGIPIQAEACHAEPVESDCCCAGNNGNVSNGPAELPPALAASGQRFLHPDSHAAPPSVRAPAAFVSRLPRTVVNHSVAARHMSSLYLMNASFLI